MGWGFRFLNYGYTSNGIMYYDNATNTWQEYNLTKIGTVFLQGVEFVNGGQYDTEKTAFESYKVQNYEDSSSENTIVGSTFH